MKHPIEIAAVAISCGVVLAMVAPGIGGKPVSGTATAPAHMDKPPTEMVATQETTVVVVSDKLPDLYCGSRKLPEYAADAMVKYGKKYGIPPLLLAAVAYYESSFRIDADSGRDKGLMQIRDSNFRRLKEVGIDPSTPEGNIEAAAYILYGAYNKHRTYERALMCYNCGEAGAEALWMDGVYSTIYSRKVIKKWKEWEELA